MFQPNDKIGLICCSNGLPDALSSQINHLLQLLSEMGLVPVCSPCLFADKFGNSASPALRAQSLMDFYADSSIRAIFDLSGGDLANQILDELDFACIQKHRKPFFGYSDLTVLLNALYAKAGTPSCLYQLRNLIRQESSWQRNAFSASLFHNRPELFHFSYHFLRGEKMEGTVVGGNIRCFLKLAGTPYLPDLQDKLLFLESRSGKPSFLASCFTQLRQMGAFSRIKGVLLGTFTQAESEGLTPSAEELLLEALPFPDLAVAKTRLIGHGPDSRCLILGRKLCLTKNTKISSCQTVQDFYCPGD